MTLVWLDILTLSHLTFRASTHEGRFHYIYDGHYHGIPEMLKVLTGIQENIISAFRPGIFGVSFI